MRSNVRLSNRAAYNPNESVVELSCVQESADCACEIIGVKRKNASVFVVKVFTFFRMVPGCKEARQPL